MQNNLLKWQQIHLKTYFYIYKTDRFEYVPYQYLRFFQTLQAIICFSSNFGKQILHIKALSACSDNTSNDFFLSFRVTLVDWPFRLSAAITDYWLMKI